MTSKSIHILYTIPCLKLGGTEIQMLSVIKALPQNYKKTVLVYFNEIDTDIAKRYKAENCDLQFLNLERKNFSGIFGALRLIKIIRKQFKNSGADIVHIQYLAPAFQPIVAAWLAGKRIFATIHASGVVYKWNHKLLVRLASHLTDKFICVSKECEKFWFGSAKLFSELTENDKQKHFTVFNVVDTDHIKKSAVEFKNAVQTRFQIPSEKKIIGFVGRLVALKQVDILVNAFAEVIKNQKDIHLLIVGEGAEQKKIEKLIETHQISENTILTGLVSQEEVFALMNLMYVLVVPSQYEGFGLTAIEAMTLGKPVIGNNIDGLRDIIVPNKNGMIVNHINSENLKDAIINILDNKLYQNLSQNCLTTVNSNFSYTTFRQQMQKIY